MLPVRDEERYVAAAVESILRQTFRDFELIVVDDGSTDRTAEIVGAMAAADGRIRCVRPDASGLVEALNAGLAAATGIYVARMDADDVALPERLARQVAELDRRPGLGVLGTRVRYVDADGRPIGTWKVPVGTRLVHWTLAFGTPIAHPSVMIRRAVLPSVPYTRTHPHAEDFDLWVRLSSETTLDNLPDTLLERRVHGESVSDRNVAAQEESTVLVRRRAIAAALGDAPSPARVAALTRPRSAMELVAVALLIGRLYLATPRDTEVRRDAGRRIAAAAKAVWRRP